MHTGMRWLGLVLGMLVASLLSADDKKEDKKPKPGTQEKKDASKKKDDKKKEDKKAAADDETPKETKTPAASLRAPSKAKPKYAQIVRAKLGKLDNAPKYGIIVKEPYLNGKNIDYRDKEVEVEASDELVVRTEILPVRFDEKGNPRSKAYTAKELKELKGTDKTLPGYGADVDSLKPGQIVNVFLGKKANAGKNDPVVIVMICILAEP